MSSFVVPTPVGVPSGLGGGVREGTWSMRLSIRRSKMILTRLVEPQSLRKRRARTSEVDGVVMPEPREGSLPLTQLPLEAALNRNEPVATYLFQRGVVAVGSKRRSGDPPYKYLELRYAHVEPFSPVAGLCSNPRARGGLRRWYQTAREWNLLHCDFRERLVLGKERRVGGGGEGRKMLSGGGSVVRKPVGGVGPLMVEGKWARAMGRAPRVIVVGDVHGCISELQGLLRLADFQPGDQVVLLGDLVAKGPDSVGVVQLAREIGAKSVRGNHDYEVVRWWEARNRGDGNAMVSMEHAKIARMLGREEHEWLMECPWFIECADMGHLFVHAGFIPGVKLTQQNPRLMMNMRSVLQDGTVTAKNVGGCAWARLWRGPQMVVFGHDAFRGLQMYEFATGIDTGCVYGGRLTALLLPENRMVSVPAKRAYISPKKFRVGRTG